MKLPLSFYSFKLKIKNSIRFSVFEDFFGGHGDGFFNFDEHFSNGGDDDFNNGDTFFGQFNGDMHHHHGGGAGGGGLFDDLFDMDFGGGGFQEVHTQGGGGGGRKCRTITKRQGNMVSTQTICS